MIYLLEFSPPVSSDLETMTSILCKSEKLYLLLKIIDEIKKRQEKVIIFAINKKLQKFLSVGLDTLYGVSVDIVNGDTKAVSSRSERGAKSRMQIIERFEAQPGFGIIVMSPLAAV